MDVIRAIMIGIVFSYTPQVTEPDFITWWSGYDEHIQAEQDYVKRYSWKTERPFAGLPVYAGTIAKPPAIRQDLETAFVLYERPNLQLLLVTPRDIMKDKTTINEDFKQTIKQCEHDTSWIVALPKNVWTEIGLNPYCTMAYGPDEINIGIYRIDSSPMPLIDISTQNLTCTPHYLYGWDQGATKYALKSQKCTGPRTFRNFPSETNYQEITR